MFIHKFDRCARCIPAAAVVATLSAMLAPAAAHAQTSVRRGAGRQEATPVRLASTRRPVTDTSAALADAAGPARADSTPNGDGYGGDVIDAATREYRERGIARPVVQGNFVAFPYGHSEPVLTCTVLRACIIELEAGEAVINEPIAGDQVRWLITGAKSGPEGSNTLVVVKPKDCDITTNLVIPTDRRIYDLTLDSPPCKTRSSNPQQPFVRHVRFYYPDDEAGRIVNGFASGFAGVGGGRNVVPGISPEHLNFDYRVKKDRKFPWAPAQVFEDGAHVFIKLPPEARTSVAPVLFALEEDGTRTILNYAVREDLYVADRTFRRGVLVIGDGKKEQRVEIENRSFGKTSDAGRH